MQGSEGLSAENTAEDTEGRTPVGDLEARVAELERLSEELGRAPDGELSGLLEKVVKLVDEVNAGIESRIASASAESGEVEGLLDRVDFGPFDDALGSLERESPRSGSGGSGGPERQGEKD